MAPRNDSNNGNSPFGQDSKGDDGIIDLRKFADTRINEFMQEFAVLSGVNAAVEKTRAGDQFEPLKCEVRSVQEKMRAESSSMCGTPGNTWKVPFENPGGKTFALPETELDMYEHFMNFGRTQNRDDVSKLRVQHGDPFKSKGDEKSTMIASTVTTEMTVLPDGTRHSRRVVEKRFANWMKETKEDVSSSQNGKANNKKAESGGGGWFWAR